MAKEAEIMNDEYVSKVVSDSKRIAKYLVQFFDDPEAFAKIILKTADDGMVYETLGALTALAITYHQQAIDYYDQLLTTTEWLEEAEEELSGKYFKERKRELDENDPKNWS